MGDGQVPTANTRRLRDLKLRVRYIVEATSRATSARSFRQALALIAALYPQSSPAPNCNLVHFWHEPDASKLPAFSSPTFASLASC